MTFLTGYGSLAKTTTSTRLSIKNQNLKKVKNVVIKLPAARTVPLQNSFHLCSASTFQTIIRFILSSGCIKPSPLMDPSAEGWFIQATFHLPVTEPLWKPQGLNAPKGFAAVQKALAVAANGSFHNQAATGDGILPEINIFLDTIFTCLLLLILKTAFLFFQCLNVLPGMTCSPSCILFSL